MDQTSIEKALQNIAIQKIDYFKQIGSTNDAANQWLSSGGQGIYLCVADEQLKGRGRDGRKWQSPPNSALAFSLAFSKDHLPQIKPPLITGLTSVAISKTLENIFKLEPKIKWPNDILVDRKKIGGILTEANWQGDEFQSLIVGIGINVASSSIAEEAHFRFPATYIETETKISMKRVELLASFVNSILQHFEQFSEQQLLAAWEERMAFIGETIEIQLSEGKAFSGKLVGIDSSARLRLQDEDGKEARFAAGEIRQQAFVDRLDN